MFELNIRLMWGAAFEILCRLYYQSQAEYPDAVRTPAFALISRGMAWLYDKDGHVLLERALSTIVT